MTAWPDHEGADKSVWREMLVWLVICYVAYKIGRVL